VSVDSENSETVPVETISGVDVQIGAFCGINGAGDATFEIAGGGEFSVSGLYDATGVATVSTTSGGPQQINGVVQRDDNDQSGIFEINASTTGQVNANLVVTSNGLTAIVDVFLAGSTSTHCEVRGVGVPTT
jgi:hypothetical protein